MARKPQRPQRRKNSGAVAARRKAAIDRGLTADKVPGFDPGAAPLGTDDEAGGAPAVAVAEPPPAAGRRVDPASLAADPSGTDRRRYRMQDGLIWPAIGIAVLIVLAIIVAVLFAAG